MCRFDAVIHFAGRKAVGESVEFPMLYYTHNVLGTINLIEVMRKHNVKNVSALSLMVTFLDCSWVLGALCVQTPGRQVYEVLFCASPLLTDIT